nr:MAG TPA: Thioredoxin-like [Caudoviricetes sp.]
MHDRCGSVTARVQKGRRRCRRSFVRRPLSDKPQVLLHHWSDGCRCCRGLRAHVTGEKLLWPPRVYQWA